MNIARSCQRAGLSFVALWLGGFAGGASAGQQDRLEVPSRQVPKEWLTKAERSEFRETPCYDETIEFCRRLASASAWIDYQTFGVSPEGRALPLVIASKDRGFTPKAARAADRVVVLIQNCIHPGECAGKDASLMLGFETPICVWFLLEREGWWIEWPLLFDVGLEWAVSFRSTLFLKGAIGPCLGFAADTQFAGYAYELAFGIQVIY